MAAVELGAGTLVGGDYVVESVLARGGMGVVYVATQKSTRKRRALKVMTPQPGDLDQVRRRFEREAHVASQIESDHVVEVIGAGVDDGTELAWLAMELLDGEDLESYLARRRRLEWTDAWNVVGEACHALEAAHRLGVVHRDLKPSNVFLARSRRPGVEREVKILDFGIAKRTTDAAKTTGTLGTPLYMAPEQTLAGAAFSPATDVWALGLLVFELLVGRSYWRSASAEEARIGTLLREIILEPLVPASDRATELGASAAWLPPGFDAWFSRCVARDATERYQDAGEAYRGLAQIMAVATGADPGVVPAPSPGARPVGREGPAVRPPSVHEARTVNRAEATGSSRSRVALLLGGTIGGAVAVVAAFLALRGAGEGEPPAAAQLPPRGSDAVDGPATAAPLVVPAPAEAPPPVEVGAVDAVGADPTEAPPPAAPIAPAGAAATGRPAPPPAIRQPGTSRPTGAPRAAPPPAASSSPPRPPKDPVIL